MIDSRTTNLNLPLPDAENTLDVDVQRIISALLAIDAAVAGKATPADVAAAVAGKATHADVAAALAALVDTSPAALNTLNELAAALNDDPVFAATVTSQLALKANQTDTTAALSAKQVTLISGTNIKTLNGVALLGGGDIAGVASVNGMTGSVTLPPTQSLTYTNRSTLRSQTPVAGALAIIEGLGLFVWTAASTEPDDDESAFATASGVWLLQAAAWDLVDAWQSVDDAARDEFDEDAPTVFATSFATSFATKILTGSATCAIVSVASVSSASFTGTVTGAAVGDRVLTNPPAQLGDTAITTGDLSYHAWVSSANTVTIMLTNASAQLGTTNTAIRKAWPVTVIKS